MNGEFLIAQPFPVLFQSGGQYNVKPFPLSLLPAKGFQHLPLLFGEHDRAVGTGNVIDPCGPSSGSYRIARGGSWNFSANYCSVCRRSNDPSNDRYNDSGNLESG